MSDASTISSGPGETWRPTGEVRWCSKRKRLTTRMLQDFEYAQTVLQQRWASNTGADEWRDVPTVEG